VRHEPELPKASPLILIIEDSRVVGSELKRVIEKNLGFRVELVSTYADAHAFLSKYARDIFLAILDLHLPDAPNGEIVDLLCSMTVPSLVFTSDFSEATRKRIQAKEIVDYIIKDSHAVDNVLGYVRRLCRNRNIKALVVEDSEVFRLFVSSLLHRQMFQVEDFPDAESALEYIEKHNDVSMVVIDYALPGMDGIELTRRIREKYEKDELVIIGLSSVSDEMLTPRYIKSGANEFITKPFGLEAFFSRINHQAEVFESIRALRKANEIKNQFLGMAAHDLRTPINSIRGLTSMLAEGMCGKLTEDQREIVGYINEANDQMNALVGDLLDVSVIESGKLQLKKRMWNLKSVVEERVRIQGFAARKKGIQITCDLSKLSDFEFDRGRVGQVLDNLLSNAVKFSPKNAVVSVSMRLEGNDALVCVTDQGEGIPPDEAQLLFNTFQTTSVQPTDGEPSTGLGLAIVRKIVTNHGGKVWAESEYGSGATFCFTLPMS